MGNDGLQLVSRTGTTSDARNPLQVPGSFADPHPRRAFTHGRLMPRQRHGQVRKTGVMALDRDRLVALCCAIGGKDDPECVALERPHRGVAATEIAALTDAVRPDPRHAFDLALAELRRVERGESSWATDFAELFDVLRSIDAHWLDVLIDLVPVERAVWDGMRSMLGDDQLHLIVERLGLDCLVAAYLETCGTLDRGTDDRNWWAVILVGNLDWWASEALQRALLLCLIEHTTLRQLWSVAAGPLEDFLTDDPDRLDWMEEQAAVNPRFRDALAGVWTSGKSSATAARIAAIAPDGDDVGDRWGG